jgi:molecular chaperone GrpE
MGSAQHENGNGERAGERPEAAERDDGKGAVRTREIERLRQDLADEQQRGLRLLADFENFRRRAAREYAAARDDGRRAALLPLLPVLDTLERALAACSTDPVFYQGVEATYRLFLAALEESGAAPIESVGQLLDPAIHEAVATESGDGKAGTVVREVRRGWRLGTAVLRPVQVIVAIAPPTPVQENQPDGDASLREKNVPETLGM